MNSKSNGNNKTKDNDKKQSVLKKILIRGSVGIVMLTVTYFLMFLSEWKLHFYVPVNLLLPP